MTDEILKPFWKSKTIWVNAIVLAAMVIQMQTGFIVSPEEQIGILAVVNLVLRVVTKEPLGS
jgi:hypothetical protein